MRSLFRYLKPFKATIILILALVFLQSLSDLILPTIMSDIIDKGVVNSNIPYIWRLGGFMLLITALGTVCSVAASFYAAKVSMKYGRDLRFRIFGHVEHFSLQEFD